MTMQLLQLEEALISAYHSVRVTSSKSSIEIRVDGGTVRSMEPEDGSLLIMS